MTSLTIEKFDNVCKVHVIVEYDVSVILHQRQSDEENEMWGADVTSRPDRLPNRKHVVIQKLCQKSTSICIR